MGNKKFNNLIISNLTSEMKSSFEGKWNISESDEICKKVMKYLKKRWDMSERDEELYKLIENQMIAKKWMELTSAPWETRNSTIW
jgi:hypothetical protein